MSEGFPKLLVLSGPEEGLEFSLAGHDVVYIGRSDENALVLKDTSVSRRHASLSEKEGRWVLRDESSRNGTYLDDRQLKTETETPIQNAQIFKMGAYDIRFLERDFSESEIADKTSYKKGALPPKSETFEDREEAVSVGDTDRKELELELSGSQGDAVSNPPKGGKGIWLLVFVALFCAAIGIGLTLTYEDWKEHLSVAIDQNSDEHDQYVLDDEVVEESDQEHDVENEIVEDDTADQSDEDTQVDTETPDTDKNTDGGIEGNTNDQQEVVDQGQQDNTNEGDVETIKVEAADTIPTVIATDGAKEREFKVFLEVVTEPFSADVIFEGDDLGRAPFKKSIEVEPNKKYVLYADYELRELNDIYRKKVEFRVRPDADIVELKIDAELGIMKILKLPRKVDFYLEGYYDYDKLKANPVKISDIVYGRPIYLPYGTYVVELREKTKIAGSDNLVNVIRYQREYRIDQNNRILDLNVKDKDLQFFPAIIKSHPTGAKIHFDGEELGETPYEGNLPLGKNKIKISKEGFFDHVLNIDMQMNSVYEITVDLKTSKIGELINKAKEQLRHEQFSEAINSLIEALKFGGSAKEKSEVYFLLGESYFRQKNYEQAMPYYEKASHNELYFDRATMGMARVFHAQKQSTRALKEIVKVLVNLGPETPNNIRVEANSVFKQISPVNSVMYIYSDPPGARVFINDKPVQQETPMILSDLGVGNYRMQIEKPGYKPYKTKQNMKVGEFLLVKIKLTPESQ